MLLPPDGTEDLPPESPSRRGRIARRVALGSLAVLVAASGAGLVAEVLLGRLKPPGAKVSAGPKVPAVPTVYVHLGPNVTPAPAVTPNLPTKGSGPPLQFWHPFGADAGNEPAAHAAIWNAFSAATGIPVANTAFPSTITEPLLTVLRAAISAGQPPDAVLLDRLQLPGAMTSNLIEDLAAYSGKDGVTATAYYPHVWADVHLASRMTAVPFGADARGLWWRNAYLTQQSIDPNHGPATLEVLTRLAVPPILTPQKQQQWGFSPYVGESHPYTWGMPFGARWYDPATRRLTAAAPANSAALDWYAAQKSSQFPPSASGGPSPLLTGQVQALVDGHWLVSALPAAQQATYGAAPLPPLAGHPATTTWSSGYGVALPPGAATPDRSWSFAAYYGGQPAALAYLAAGGRRVMPAQPALAALPSVLAPGKLWQVFLAMLPTAWARPAIPEADFAWVALADAAERILHGQESPAVGLQALDAAVNGALLRDGW